jgi:hypothetical protein
MRSQASYQFHELGRHGLGPTLKPEVHQPAQESPGVDPRPGLGSPEWGVYFVHAAHKLLLSAGRRDLQSRSPISLHSRSADKHACPGI